MHADPLILSIDLGTGGPKVALVDPRGGIAASANRAIETARIGGDGAEQDPDAIWDAIVDATRQVVSEAAAEPERVEAVTVASQFSSVVPVDAEGQALHPLILWMDTRGAPFGQALYQRAPEAGGRFLELHGALPLPSGNDTLSHMLWVKHERPDVYERAHVFLEPMDYVTARLTGRCTASPCSAFLMLLTDNTKLGAIDWCDELIGFAGIDREKLPPLIGSRDEVGTLRDDVARALGLRRATRVFAGLNDTQAIAVGAGAFDGRGGVNVGTTSQVLAHVPFKATDIEHDIVSAPSPLADQYVAIAENGLGARALDHFLRSVVHARDALGDHATPDPFASLERTLQATRPGANGLLFLPWLTGANAPRSDGHVRGGFLNVSLDTTRPDMVRAICEGVALNARWLLPEVEVFAKQRFDHLRFTGGGALSEGWARILADVTGRPVLQLDDARHAINRATALLGFESLGAGALDEKALCPVRRGFEPDADAHALYEERFAHLVAAFDANRPIFHALNSRT